MRRLKSGRVTSDLGYGQDAAVEQVDAVSGIVSARGPGRSAEASNVL
jgi:hypothetical protein